MQVAPPPLAGAATAAAAVLEETSRAVASKGIEAPDADRSFVSMDQERAGLVDDEGLPLIYDKDAIQNYWKNQGGALQQRWVEFLGVTVPFITRVAGLLVSGGTDALEENAADLARDARENLEKLCPTYIKMGQMMSVRPDVLPQPALVELAKMQDGVQARQPAPSRHSLLLRCFDLAHPRRHHLRCLHCPHHLPLRRRRASSRASPSQWWSRSWAAR